MFYIYVFASRNESAAFCDYLKMRGIGATLIATPKECMVGCGLSVRVPYMLGSSVHKLLSSFSYKYTFKGIFSLERVGIRNIVKRV